MKNIKNIIEQKYPPENPNDLWMKDNVLYKSTHKGWTPLTTGGGSSTNGVTSTTWLELKDKRDAGKLTPGALYRITDYNCTTTQENTQSAGHQFDIVLLALSENKLAEEGWAMMHDNIYDVTFADGVTKKCYIYVFDDEGDIYLVDVDTLLGFEGNINVFEIDEDNKTAQTSQLGSDVLTDEDLPYNYFQNSNLSAWKVWYCLDNDKSRFAWADDSVDISLIEVYIGGGADNVMCMRDSSIDVEESSIAYFGWSNTNAGMTYYTTTEEPSTTDKLYGVDKGGGIVEMQETIVSYYEGTGLSNGRGVIYRLIDEYNNDVAYDFKNIQHKKHILDGLIDPDNIGTDTYVYPFNVWINEGCQDASLVGNTLVDEVNEIGGVCNNKILNCSADGGDTPLEKFKVKLNDSCCLSLDEEEGYLGIFDCSIDRACVNCVIQESYSIKLEGCFNVTVNSGEYLELIRCAGYKDTLSNAIYINNKKVLTES